MRFKHKEYTPEFILELEEAGFEHISQRIGVLESRAHFMFEEGSVRIPILVKYFSTLSDIQNTEHKMGAYLKNGKRSIISITFLDKRLEDRRKVVNANS